MATPNIPAPPSRNHPSMNRNEELTTASLRQIFQNHLYCGQGRDRTTATINDFYMAAAHTVRDLLMRRWMNTVRKIMQTDTKVVCYFSAEFLTGPHLGNNLVNLGIFEMIDQVTTKFPQVKGVATSLSVVATTFTCGYSFRTL